MRGDYSNMIVRILESISQYFSDLSINSSEVLCGDDGNQNRFQRALYLFLGAIVILLYGAGGILFGLFRLAEAAIFGKFHTVFMNRPAIMKKEIVAVLSVCSIAALMVLWLSKEEWAKEVNLHYFKNRATINEICRYNISVNTANGNTYVYHLRSVMESNNSSSQVNLIREQVGDTLPQGLCFATVSDYLVTLLTCEQFDALARCAELDYFMTDKNRGNAGLFHSHLEKKCKDYFCSGSFYKSNICLDIIFKFSKFNSIKKNRPSHNNSFYLMKLFNENIMDRYVAQYPSNNMFMQVVEDVSNIDILQWRDCMPNISKRDKDIVAYLSCIKALREGNIDEYEEISEKFLNLYRKTESGILKQYSLYNALRAYAESKGVQLRGYEISSDQQVSKILYKWQYIEDLCKTEITYPFLLNTMDAYTCKHQLEGYGYF